MMEEELSLLDEINARIPASDFQAEYYPDGMVRITLSITAEMAGQVKALTEQQGWPQADTYVAMLASGIGASKEARARELLAEDSETARDELDLLVKQMRRMETQYAVMKFRTWNFLQAYQASAMSQGALVNRANGLARVVDRLRAENDALKQRVQPLEATLAQSCEDASQPYRSDRPTSHTTPGRLQRMLQRLMSDR